MSSRRKLQRKARESRRESKDGRAKSSSERFKQPGSEKLWIALLGWPDSRVVRMWLLDAVHDALLGDGTGQDVQRTFAARRPDLAPELSPEELDKCLELWRDAGSEGALHFHYLAALMERLGLGDTPAESLGADYRIWISLAQASPAHKALLASLAQAERAATLLFETTQSEPVGASAVLLRSLWASLAYGNTHALGNVRHAAAALTKE
ncbi:MAG: hypothetical protein R3B13_31205 [Polyangiaceae bacterium]